MPGLSDKLKSLGVQIGAQNLPPPPRRSPSSLEQVLSGRPYLTPLGETFVVEARYPAAYQYGRTGLFNPAPLQTLASWAGENRICEFSPQMFAFLDTETTGLSGGAGTFAFLIGIGRFEGDEFHLAQFFMRDPVEEPAQLAALEEFLAPCQALVTFNGKAFDIPILNNRFITHGWRAPFSASAHVDLLHLARRLWRDRLPSRTLGNLEVQILGTRRTEEDVPGWMVPQLYIDYIRSGDAGPLKGVFYHNAMDVLSLAALFNHTAALLADPFSFPLEYAVDRIALARLFEDLGNLDAAVRLYMDGLEADLPQESLVDAIQRLALLHKRQDRLEAAVPLWERAARLQHLEAHVELAKFYEHHLCSYQEAAVWTRTAMEMLPTLPLPAYLRRQWQSDLAHRLERLERKLAKRVCAEEDDSAED